MQTEIAGVKVLFVEGMVFDQFEQHIAPQERYCNTEVSKAGYTNLTFKGVPILPNYSGEVADLDYDISPRPGFPWPKARDLFDELQYFLASPVNPPSWMEHYCSMCKYKGTSEDASFKEYKECP